jgi:hypothetical protein
MEGNFLVSQQWKGSCDRVLGDNDANVQSFTTIQIIIFSLLTLNIFGGLGNTL